jgi:hypothetical protein
MRWLQKKTSQLSAINWARIERGGSPPNTKRRLHAGTGRTGNVMRGELRLARETVERFCREADSGPWPTDVAIQSV